MALIRRPPKFTKAYVSWKCRAIALETYLKSTGHSVDYGEDWAVVMFDGQRKNKPLKWWQLWTWL